VKGENFLNNLTSEKKEIIGKKATFVVKAGPGSGKTLAVAIKLYLELKEWQYRNRGLAAISFTNVAWREIEAKIVSEFEIASGLTYPHYIGTLDSFINKFILLPFGHLVMGCSHRPEIIVDWQPNITGNQECWKGCKLKDISYDASGNLICYDDKSHFKNCSCNHHYCERTKKTLHRRGYVTQADANYYALKILETYPIISQSIAYRFPVVFVDEAQDTSEIQMKILERLLSNGLERIMLIGDPNQAIYEWRIANPHIFLEKMKQWGTLPLNENWRSSKKICDFSDKLLKESYNSIARNEEVANFDFDPQVWGYRKDKPINDEAKKLIDQFLDLCRKNDIEIKKDKVAILVRGKNMIREIIGGNGQLIKPWRESFSKNGKSSKDTNRNHYANITKSRYLFDKGEYGEAFNLFERTISAIIMRKEYVTTIELGKCYEEMGLKEWRKRLFRLLTNLPKTDIPLGKWVESANSALIGQNNALNIGEFQIKIKKSREDNRYDESNIRDIFGIAAEDDHYTIGTVHSIKGKEFEAVLLILKEKSANEKYSKMINKNLADKEEMRIIYVAITRPKKLLVIATPEEDRKIWQTKFYGNIQKKQKKLFEF